MSKYAARYRCQLCGQLIHYGNPAEVPYDKLPELLGQVVKQQAFLGTSLYQAPMQIPHKCADGSGGLAYFVGFKKLD